MKKIFYIIILLSLSGCADITAHSSTKLEVGQTKQQVIKIMGKPSEKRGIENREFYVYYLHNSMFDFMFSKKNMPYVGFYPLLRTGKEFWVILDDDIVVAFGYADNFKNSVPKALNKESISVEIEK